MVAVAEAAWLAVDRTTNGYRPAASVGGICALIWPGDVANRGRGTLFSVTQAPPITVGMFAAPAALSDDARLRPKIENNPPGAMAVVKLAAFTTGLGASRGRVAAGTGASGMTLRPEAVTTNALAPPASIAMVRPLAFARPGPITAISGPSSALAVAVTRCVATSTTSTRPA